MRFDRPLREAQAGVYYAALAGTAAAIVLFIAPAAHHRVGFRGGDKDYVVCKGNREAIAESIALGLALTAALHLVTFDAVVAAVASGALFALIVWRWWALALYRNRLRNQPSGPMSAGVTRARAGPLRGSRA